MDVRGPSKKRLRWGLEGNRLAFPRRKTVARHAEVSYSRMVGALQVVAGSGLESTLLVKGSTPF